MSNVVMSKEDLRQAQKVMLYIMKAIHRVCVKYNIKYWLDYGTLLGAIRHKGFIPWDDDMDICMMREDYDRFCEIAPKELGEEFFLQTPETDSHFYSMFAKLRLNETLWLDRHSAVADVTHKGLFIDIFPMDPMPRRKLHQRWIASFYDKFFNGIKDYKCYKIKGKTFLKTFRKFVLSSFVPLWLIQTLLRRKLRQLQRYRTTSPYISKLAVDCWRDICHRDLFNEIVLHSFEDVELYIPKQYDERLRSLFGDYMQLPPENERYNRHNVLKFDLGKYKNL